MTPQNQILCPNCPKCGSLPLDTFIEIAQAFCPNDNCDVLCWTPSESASVNLSDAAPAIVWADPEPTA